MLRNRKLQLVGAFLLGFTVWIPFAMLALDLCPYRLVIIGASIGSEWWGWERKPQMISPDYIVDGAYQGFFALGIFYAFYVALVAAVYLIVRNLLKSRKSEQSVETTSESVLE